MIRRQFLKAGLLSSVLASVPTRSSAKIKENRFWPFDDEVETNYHLRSILQGATDSSRTQFSILHPVNESLTFYFSTQDGDEFYPDKVDEIVFENHPNKLSKIYVSGLREGNDYYLNLKSSTGEIVDSRSFATLSTNKDSFRFALASCMDDAHHDSGIWQDMIEKDPDVIFFIGDSVYADRLRGREERNTADPDQLWLRFSESRLTLDIYQSKKLKPIIAVWDDHDFGRNDIGKSYPYVKESQKNFLSFFSQEEEGCSLLKRGPGVGSAFKFRDQLFLLLDGRSFRETNSSNDRYAHWGEEQEAWALNQIDQHNGFVWIMTGTQIFPSMIFKESVSKQHPNHLKGLTEELKRRGTKVAFASGDVHFSEISQIEERIMGYQTFEFTSSSIHSTTFPGVPELIPNKRRIESTGKRNYLLLESQVSESDMRINVKSHSSNNRVNFERNFIV